jgi:hypothetical protein
MTIRIDTNGVALCAVRRKVDSGLRSVKRPCSVSVGAFFLVLLPRADRVTSRSYPNGRQCCDPDMPMEPRIRPILHAIHMTMLHRIEVDVIHVHRQVTIVANQVFPIAPLTDTALAPLHAPL